MRAVLRAKECVTRDCDRDRIVLVCDTCVDVPTKNLPQSVESGFCGSNPIRGQESELFLIGSNRLNPFSTLRVAEGHLDLSVSPTLMSERSPLSSALHSVERHRLPSRNTPEVRGDRRRKQCFCCAPPLAARTRDRPDPGRELCPSGFDV